MNDAPEQDGTSDELPAIEFRSPGRFSVHNPAAETAPAQPWEPAPFKLGDDTSLQRFSLAEAARAHALALMQQAERSLCLFSPDLEPWLYNHSSIQDACTRLLLRHPQNRLRILLRDSSRATREGHRLLNLSRRLSSNCHIRLLNPDYPQEEHAFLLADQVGMLIRTEPAQPGGHAWYNNPGRVRQLQAQFNLAWDTSLSDPNLRSFLL
ncbi:DUF7931 domain-containing protein [Pseudomonas panipatensis]|uniref:DUF7931 domain-containing protein n=1 Tax=Pseudomonas panipatensis TaxID=428992 RepID=A0A1G8IBB4_9PSED|nr:histone acetyltransferase HPA2 [Pseudomonas panipatensis]SDI16225.1 hypothetical protein SAMN05216272_106151 [Pseudomonas panipatensis]SMP78960.1 hypothetical protein SAMN06295951_12018 [Pseudomonas panipatensis]